MTRHLTATPASSPTQAHAVHAVEDATGVTAEPVPSSTPIEAHRTAGSVNRSSRRFTLPPGWQGAHATAPRPSLLVRIWRSLSFRGDRRNGGPLE